MINCRNPQKLGYDIITCPNHPEQKTIIPHTCKSNICPTCAKIQTEKWAEEIQTRLPATKYSHITFTIPKELRDFFGAEDPNWHRKNDMYKLANESIKGFFWSKHILGGGMSILHTFGRALNINPHIHTAVPLGGLYKNNKNEYEWKEIKISQKYLRTAWSNNVKIYVLEHDKTFQKYHKQLTPYVSDFASNQPWLHRIIRKITKTTEECDKWMKILTINYNVFCAERDNEKCSVLGYLARYTKRLPISQKRIINWDKEKQLVTWKYTPHNKKKDGNIVKDTISAHQFIDSLIQHIAPKHFKKIRYFGIFANKNSKKYLAILKELLPFNDPKEIPDWGTRQFLYTGVNPCLCAKCQHRMVFSMRFYPNPDSNGREMYVVTYNEDGDVKKKVSKPISKLSALLSQKSTNLKNQ
jgi:hypothetical protein